MKKLFGLILVFILILNINIFAENKNYTTNKSGTQIIGVERLIQIMNKNHPNAYIVITNKEEINGETILTILGETWMTGKWKCSYTTSEDKSIRVAPKDGYWYGAYILDEKGNMKSNGTYIAVKLKN